MSANRVLLHFAASRRVQPPCPCCKARRLHDRLNATCERIELDCESAIEFVIPTVYTLAGDREESDFDDPRDIERGPRVKFYIVAEPASAPIDGDLREYAIGELRRLSSELATAADRIEAAGLSASASGRGCPMTSATTLAAVFEAYQDARKKRLAVSTTAIYRRALQKFDNALGYTATVADLNAEKYAVITAWMEEQRYEQRSILMTMEAFGVLARFALGRSVRPSAGSQGLPAPSLPSPEAGPDRLSDESPTAISIRRPDPARPAEGERRDSRSGNDSHALASPAPGNGGRGRVPARIELQSRGPGDGAMALEQLFITYEKKKLRGKSYGTSMHYRSAISIFSTHLRREPTLDDLTDDVVTDFMWWLVEARRNTAATALSLIKKILALWRFACRQGLLRVWPEVELMDCPKHDPIAWSKEEMQTIFRAVRSQEGMFGKVPAADYWAALLLTFWDTAERFTAVLSLRPADVNLQGAWVVFPAECRKGKLRDRGMPLNPLTVEALRRVLDSNPRRLIFEAPLGSDGLRNRYKVILRDAGLPHDRKRLFHCIRKTVASHFESLGHDATELLDHSMRKVTTDSYLSPQIVKRSRPADVLFRPEPDNARELSEAEARVRRYAAAQRFADLVERHGDSLKAWIPIYLAECVEEVSGSTRQHYADVAARFESFIGHDPRLEDLTLTRLLQFAVSRIEGGVSEATADRERSLLAAVRRFVEGMRGQVDAEEDAA